MQLCCLFLFYQQDIKKFKVNLKNIEVILKKKCQKDPFKEGGQSFFLMLVSASYK